MENDLEPNEYYKQIYIESHDIDAEFSKKQMSSCTFKNCDLSHANFSESSLEDCVFIETNLSLVNFENSHLQNIKFIDCKILGINYTKANQFGLDISFENCVIKNCNFCHMSLKKTKFEDSEIIETDFIGTNLCLANFKKVKFRDVSFNNTNLEKADFRNALGYSINPYTNVIKKAKFSLPEAVNFLNHLGIDLVD